MDKNRHYTDPGQQGETPAYDDVSAAQYVNGLQPIREKRKRKKRARWLLVIGLAAAAGYFVFAGSNNKSAQQSEQNDTEQSQQDPGASSELQEYVSSDRSIRFSYPGNWQVNDSDPDAITVESPIVKLTDLSGNREDAKVVVSFLRTGTEVPGFDADGAIAVKDSEILAYSSPTQNQRAETYLSFGGFGSRALHAVFVTGDSGYQVEQLIPQSDVVRGDPVIAVLFYACQEATCETSASNIYAIDPGEWSANETLQDAYSLLVSLEVE